MTAFLFVSLHLLQLWVNLDAAPTVTNIDTVEPAVILSPARSMDPDDGFGWAAIFHQIEEVSDDDSLSETLRKTRVLIGAPRGTYPGGLNLADPGEPASNRSGLVYSCPIGPGECEGVRGDTSRYIGGDVSENFTNGYQYNPSENKNIFIQPIAEGRLFDQAPDAESRDTFVRVRQVIERKDGQLMGSVLYSNGDYVVACAPRWTTSGFVRQSHPRGICFSGDRNLTNFKTQYPCTGPGNSRSTLDEGYCSAGIGTTIMADRIHIGAPGIEESTGSFFSRLLSLPIETDFTETMSHLNDQVPDTQRQVPYLGFQMASGYITDNDRSQGPPDLLVCSPRDNQTLYIGRIYLYNAATLGTIQRGAIAKGRQMAEFFGHSIALSDLTGDGYDELLVGAPMYTALGTPVNPTPAVERGRLYIFFNNGGTLDPDPVIIEGSVAHSRFGFVVTNIGDADADGHEDLAVGAPYETSSASTQNTGAVYIYYGRNTKEEFASQTPQKIHADDIVSSVTSLPMLRTFGFSLSGNKDVDNNQYKDLVAGGYLDQAVVVLRSLPVVNVTVGFGELPLVSVDEPEPTVQVTVSASFIGVQVPGPLRIPFTLSEVVVANEGARLYFTGGDPEDIQYEGTFTISGPDVTVEQTINVYAESDFTETVPYQLRLELNDIERAVAPQDGQQPITTLLAFPRIRQIGNNTAMLNIINLCGDHGCASDVSVTVDTQDASLTLVQGRDQVISLPVMYSNAGPEEARNLEVTITYDFPAAVFRQISWIGATGGVSLFTCSLPSGVINCVLTEQSLPTRFLLDQTQVATLMLVTNASVFKGNEEGFDFSVSVSVDTSDNNTDVDETNNEVVISFQLASESDINVAMLFGSEEYTYVGVVPSPIRNSFTLGDPVSLSVMVGNSGPSTIFNARVNVSFPGQVSPRSDEEFFLYPSRIASQIVSTSSISAKSLITCVSQGIIDPNDLNTNEDEFTFQVNSRNERSVSAQKQAKRKSRRNVSRGKRQMQSSTSNIVVNCETHACVSVICDVHNLTTDAAIISFEFNIDERFYGNLARKENYEINMMASVNILNNEFQLRGDDTSDNTASASVILVPKEVESSDSITLIIHASIWPAIASLIIIGIVVVILYLCGFFRRKNYEKEEEAKEEQPLPEKLHLAETTGTNL